MKTKLMMSVFVACCLVATPGLAFDGEERYDDVSDLREEWLDRQEMQAERTRGVKKAVRKEADAISKAESEEASGKLPDTLLIQ